MYGCARCCAALALAAGVLIGCGNGEGNASSDPMQDTTHYAHTNRLVHETSPYLLQHAHNPVDWYPWGEEAFARARAENKLVLVSIGYSSCHWCHVMEHESFENDSVARLMNEHFVCIKVDREERPDVDQVYMTAVQLMTGSGGWPLNCFTLPDGRPAYGGTYYPPDQWKRVLQDLNETWKREPDRVKKFAEQLHDGVRSSELVHLNEEPPAFTRKELDDLFNAWEHDFDPTYGGPDRAPKFPMPNNLQYLLRYGTLAGIKAALHHVELTLDQMAMGGIFDQVGGGFARYSTDAIWKVPHFEKMLYDNAQLVSLYSQAFQALKKPMYRETVERTLAWVQREMTSGEGAFYSALDADSEGEEGKFYVWTKAELQQLLGADYDLAAAYYNVDGAALWEHGNNILLRRMSDEDFAKAKGMSSADLHAAIARIDAALLTARDKRVRPGLDDKSLTSWNAMMVTAYCDAGMAFGNANWSAAAKKNMEVLLTIARREDGGLWHSYKNGKATINGYLEDYAFTTQALLALYGTTFDERWLNEAKALVEYAIAHFHDEASGMFWFTSDLDPPLIARKMETTDNVIPASNSAMADVLLQLGHLFDEPRYLTISERMLNNVKQKMSDYPSGYSNWAQVMLGHVFPYYEIAITGPECAQRRAEFAAYYLANRVFLGSRTESQLPLLEGKLMENSTTIFVCEKKVCQLPVASVAEAMKQIR
jgi:uncharacterized protein YyaL (SSP411 family)